MKFNFLNPNAAKLKWEKLKSKNKNVPDLYRTPIIGGWLISHDNDHSGLCFIPDPEHEWDGNSFDIEE